MISVAAFSSNGFAFENAVSANVINSGEGETFEMICKTRQTRFDNAGLDNTTELMRIIANSPQ